LHTIDFETSAQMAEPAVRLGQAGAGRHAPPIRAAMADLLSFTVVAPGARLAQRLLDATTDRRPLAVVLGGDGAALAGPSGNGRGKPPPPARCHRNACGGHGGNGGRRPARPDFGGVNRAALPHPEGLCRRWLPGGSRIGREWACGGLRGDPGASCGANLRAGRWRDFAAGQGGGDAEAPR
jgi:hypothetical protein